MSDGGDRSPLPDGGSEEPNLGDYVHEPAVDANDDDESNRRRPDADGSAADGDRRSGGPADARGQAHDDAPRGGQAGRGAPDAAGAGGAAAGGRAGGGETPRAPERGAAAEQPRGTGGTPTAPQGPGDPPSDVTAGRARQRDARPVEGGRDAAGRPPAHDPFATPEESDVWTRVGTAVSRGGVRATAAGVVGAYGLLGAGFALLAVIVGGLGPPVLVTTWETFPLVDGGALMTAVPAMALFLALFTGGYATLRHGGTDAVVAGAAGSGLGAALATALTVGAVAIVQADATVRLDGVLVDLVLLVLLAGGLAAGTTLVATRLGLSGDDVTPDGDEAGGAD